MMYMLWDTRTANLVASYTSEQDALALVLDGIARNGPDDIDTLVLEVEDEKGELVSSIHGQALIDLAKRELAGPGRLVSSLNPQHQ